MIDKLISNCGVEGKRERDTAVVDEWFVYVCVHTYLQFDVQKLAPKLSFQPCRRKTKYKTK